MSNLRTTVSTQRLKCDIEIGSKEGERLIGNLLLATAPRKLIQTESEWEFAKVAITYPELIYFTFARKTGRP